MHATPPFKSWRIFTDNISTKRPRTNTMRKPPPPIHGTQYYEAMRELDHRLRHNATTGMAECYNRCLRYATTPSERVAVGNMADAVSMAGVEVTRPFDRH